MDGRGKDRMTPHTRTMDALQQMSLLVRYATEDPTRIEKKKTTTSTQPS